MMLSLAAYRFSQAGDREIFWVAVGDSARRIVDRGSWNGSPVIADSTPVRWCADLVRRRSRFSLWSLLNA